MTWAFDVTSNIPRITQSGTDTGLAGIATAITAQATVARSTAYTTAQMVKPPTPTGFWYRCSTAGTTAASAPTYGTVLGGTTTDGGAVFTAFKAPDVQTLGTTNLYYMPDIRVQVLGALTNVNPQQQTFLCLDLFLYGASANFISGAWSSDGVTPLWDGIHFATTRTTTSGADPSAFFLQSGAQCTFIGGEVQCSGGVSFDSGTTPRSYLTRWRGTKEFGGSSSRFRSSTTTAIFENVESYDFAFDLFRMPTVPPSIRARGSEYVYQYVGSSAGGVDAKFAASNLENPSGAFAFDNYGSGWVELYNCKQGAALAVTNQNTGNVTFLTRHCVPLYQDLIITAKDTAGANVQDVRFTATESPANSPTVTFTTTGGLKTWDFRTALSYQTTTNASGVALTSPVLNVWYWQASPKLFQQSLRFPSSTATYQGRAYNYKTVDVSAVLGASAAIPVSAGMIGLDTATTVSEATALAYTGITFVPSGATGGTVTISSSRTLQEIWDYYRAWISQFANRPSSDTWTCVAGNMSMGAWNLVVNSGVTLSGSGNVTSFSTTGSVTNNGAITTVYTSSLGTSSTLQLVGVTNKGVAAVWDGAGSFDLNQTNSSGSAANYTIYYPPGSVGLVRNYARELYGSQRVSGSITLAAGLNTISFTDLQDLGIVQTNQATVAAYTTIANSDQAYDYAAYFRTLNPKTVLAVKSGADLSWGAYNVIYDGSALAVMAFAGSTVTVKASTIVDGSVYTRQVTTGNMTFVNGSIANMLYVNSVGPNSRLTLTGVSNNGVAAIWTPSTSATELFQTNVSGSSASYTLYYPPGSVSMVKNYARELYGFQRIAGSITLAAGLNTVSFVDVPDVGITEAVQATAAAYATLEFPSKFYDRTAIFRLTEQGIKLGQIVTRSGTALEIGTFSHVINTAAASVYAIIGSVITTKSSTYAPDTKYLTEIATPPATITAATTEVITIAREDANGNSQITIQAAGVSTFEIWKITDATNPDNYATGTLVTTVGVGTWRFLSANGFKFVIRDQTTNYRVVVEAEKGIYKADLFFGAQVQLAQAAEVSQINTKVDILQNDMTAVKGGAFNGATDSLAAIRAAVNTMPASVWAYVLETGHSALALMRLMASVILGKVSGAGTTTETFRDVNDTKNRVVATVDEAGNRTDITRDAS